MIREERASDDGTYRLVLIRDQLPIEGAAKGALVVWILLNPSRANQIKDDPTAHRVIDFSTRWGYPRTLVVDCLFGLVGLALLPFMAPSKKPGEIPVGAAVPEVVEP